MQSSLREQFGPRVCVGALFCVRSGSPASFILRADPAFVKTILARRHLPLRRARDVVERLLAGDDVIVELPMVESADALEGELRNLGIYTVLRDAAPHYSASAAFSR